MSANDIQVGGDHYKGVDYEVWDFLTDANIGYVPGCAIKYIFRYKKKHGREDLEKALHFIDKAIERAVPPPQPSRFLEASRAAFGATLADLPARLAIEAVTKGKYAIARDYVEMALELFPAEG